VVLRPAIPPHRLVVSRVDVYQDGGYAPGSQGAKSGRPSGFGGAVRRGQTFDILSPVVAEHVDWLEIPRRDLLPEDIERARRLEALEREA
jgi:hypothetical protein